MRSTYFATVVVFLTTLGCATGELDSPASQPSATRSVPFLELGFLEHVDVEQRDASRRFAGFARQGAVEFGGGLVRASIDGERVGLGEGIALRSASVGGALLPAGQVSVEGNVAQVERGGVVEWMVNGPRGVEHGFVVSQPVDQSGELAIDIALEGLIARSIEGGALLETQEGEAFSYTELRAWDASGRELDAHMQVEPSSLRLLIDVADAVYPVIVDPLLASLRATLEAIDGARDQEFGYSVALDGDRLAVGARYALAADGEDEGAVYIYERSGTTWAPTARVTARADMASVSDGQPDMSFGSAIDLEGDSLVVGANFFDSPAAGNAGVVYTYRRAGDGTWGHEADIIGHSTSGYGYQFGRGVSISGNLMIIGEPGSREWFIAAGAAYVYTRTGMTWTEVTSLPWTTATSNDNFGWAVAVDGTRLVVGAPGDSAPGRSQAGSAFIYQRIAGTWTQTDRLQPATLGSVHEFGRSIALEGDWLAISAPRADDDLDFLEDRGVVYVFERVAGTWTERDRVHPAMADWPYLGRFGTSISMSGDLLAVGAPNNGTGRVFVYRRQADGTYAEELNFGGRVRTGSFGNAVALDGTDLAVGAYEEDLSMTLVDQGAAFVYGLVNDASSVLGDPCSGAGECISGFCVDGVCCDTECGFGDFEDCMACSVALGGAADGTCGASAADSVCRASIGVCDAQEICDGTSMVCPSDALEAEGTVCRPAGLGCDSAEACDGINPVCPADMTAGEGSMCNDGMACTTGELCTSGVCGGGSAVPCDDGNACTADSCAEPAGCVATPITGCCLTNSDCDDSDACTTDVCASRMCTNTSTCTDAAVVGADAGPVTGADAGSAVASAGGCNCAAAGTARSDARLLLVFGFVALALRARKRRRCR